MFYINHIYDDLSLTDNAFHGARGDRRRYRRATASGIVTRRLLASVCLLLLVAGCSRVVSSDSNGLAIDTAWIADIMPRSQYLVSWPIAETHCQKFGKRPTLADIKRGVVTYVCEDGETDPETDKR